MRMQAAKLRQLRYAKPAVRKQMIKNGDKELINAICETCKNILKANVPLTPSQKRRLCRHKRTLRELVKKKVSLKRKKQILQKGGFLGALITPILSLLGGLIGSNG